MIMVTKIKRFAGALSLMLLFGLMGCGNEKDQLYSEIKAMEKVLLADKVGLNDSLAMEYAGKCMQFANQYKSDAQSPELLFKSAEVLSGINRPHLALRRFQKVYLDYPQYNKHAESIFLCGFIFENQLQDYKEAKYYYEKFLVAYPKHPLAADATASIRNLGKSPEELVKEFEAMNDTL